MFEQSLERESPEISIYLLIKIIDFKQKLKLKINKSKSPVKNEC